MAQGGYIRKKEFRRGLRDGIPIGLGYFAVAFSLGISAGNAGISPFQAGLMSFLMHASAGEFAAITVIGTGAGLLEMAVTTLIVNMRYLLMSCALSQKIDRKRSFSHRFLISHFVTDELFGIAMAREGAFAPEYYYGGALVASLGWVSGTVLGALVGNVLPEAISGCLTIALYGMFIAIVLPPAKRSRTLLVVVLSSMLASALFTYLPVVKRLSSGNRIIILTVVIAALAALIKPIDDSPANPPDESPKGRTKEVTA